MVYFPQRNNFRNKRLNHDEIDSKLIDLLNLSESADIEYLIQ